MKSKFDTAYKNKNYIIKPFSLAHCNTYTQLPQRGRSVAQNSLINWSFTIMHEVLSVVGSVYSFSIYLMFGSLSARAYRVCIRNTAPYAPRANIQLSSTAEWRGEISAPTGAQNKKCPLWFCRLLFIYRQRELRLLDPALVTWLYWPMRVNEVRLGH